MDRPEAMRDELERARRLAAQSHDPKVAELLSDYAAELERKLARAPLAPQSASKS